MAFGRWSSGAVDRYLRSAPIKTVYTISGDAALSCRGPAAAGSAARAPREAAPNVGHASAEYQEITAQIKKLLEQFRDFKKDTQGTPDAVGARDIVGETVAEAARVALDKDRAFVLLMRRGGHVHRAQPAGEGPEAWATRCGWRFGAASAEAWRYVLAVGGEDCKCELTSRRARPGHGPQGADCLSVRVRTRHGGRHSARVAHGALAARA